MKLFEHKKTKLTEAMRVHEPYVQNGLEYQTASAFKTMGSATKFMEKNDGYRVLVADGTVIVLVLETDRGKKTGAPDSDWTDKFKK